MRSKLRLLATVVAISVPYTASAEMFNMVEPYVGLAGAWNLLQKEKITDGVQLKQDFDNGWGAFGTVGARFNYGIRGELELGYRDNEVDSITGAPFGVIRGSGYQRAWTIMANGLYDFTNRTPFTPYLGVGVGAANVRSSSSRIFSEASSSTSKWKPALQGIAGVSYKVADNWSVFGNYQYITTTKLKLRTENGLGRIDDPYQANTFLLGVKYMFNAPKQMAEAPAPAPQPQAEQQTATPSAYMVFFDWNKSNVTDEARQIIRTAADNARNMNSTHIDVTGHADTSGSPAYNMRLSQRRAENVKQELVRLGVPSNEITIHAKGESEPLVATGDGVREPQNRRVEIVYGT